MKFKMRIFSMILVWMLLFTSTISVSAQEQDDSESQIFSEDSSEDDEATQPDSSEEQPEDSETPTVELPSIAYHVHIQGTGWQDWKCDGETAGTTGSSKRLEAIEITINHPEYDGGITYSTHIQGIGWQDWKCDGELSGTTGESRRLEAIQIKLTGELEEYFDIYYRVHAQSFGWLGWAKNGEKAGTSAYAKRLEAIEIKIVEKDSEAPGSTENCYCSPLIVYQTHIQSIGWQEQKFDGELSGTSGEGKRLEAIKINLHEAPYSGGITYSTHIQGIGWQDWKSDGELSGTTGQSRRIEAIQIELTGEMKEHYDVYYRVHCQTKGWLSWACNGQKAGTEGFAKRLEAIEIKVIPKDSTDKPDTSGQSYVRKYKDSEINFFGYVRDIGDVTASSNGETLGTTGQSKSLDGFGINLDQSSNEVLSGTIQYRTHCQTYGWTDWVSQGSYSGTKNEDKRMEAFQIKLTGEIANYYNIYYRAHVQSYGWLGWAKNGSTAGTTGISYRTEAIEIRLIPKNESGPATSSSCYKTVVNLPKQSGSALTSFGSYTMSSSVKNKLNSAINNFTNNGSRVGFYMIDLTNGKGVYYNSNSSFYSASTIKGPYVVSLNEKVPSSANNSSGLMKNAIKVSDNNAYISLRKTYGSSPFASWVSDAGCTDVNTTNNYIDITPRQLAQMWAKSYEFFYSGRTNSEFCRNLFTGTLNSPISSTLGNTYTVYSKAGWIGEGGYYNVQNDGGVVMRSSHPYVVVILSTAYGKMSYLNTLVSAIDAAHEELLK